MLRELGEDPLQAVDRFLDIEDQPPPDPSSLATTDVIVAVESAAVGWVDLLMTSGQYQHAPTPPYCPGMEYSGRVVWAGADVKGLSPGDHVVSNGMLTGPRSLGPYQRYGGFATYAVAPAVALQPVPGGLSSDQSCHLLSSYSTAYHCLVHRGKLLEGETVLIHGASGATGLAAVHLARILGATVIATGRSAEKLAVVQAEGAHHTVRTVDDDGAPVRFRDQVRALTGGQGVDVVYDAVGGAISLESLRCVRFGARFLIVGWAATPFVARGKGRRGAPNANQLPTNLIMMKGLDVLGCPAVISAHRDPSIAVERQEHILRWVNEGRLVPRTGATFPLEQVREAMRAKWASRAVGAVVLHPGG